MHNEDYKIPVGPIHHIIYETKVKSLFKLKISNRKYVSSRARFAISIRECHDFFRIFSISMTLFFWPIFHYLFRTCHDKIHPHDFPCFSMTVGTVIQISSAPMHVYITITSIFK